MTASRTSPATLHRRILLWYRHNGRPLAWRGQTDPYAVLVSEVMLQQTQVNRVVVKYPEFLARFPSIRVLARARQRDVVTAWRGMGYNNRAVRLHHLARIVVHHHGGTWPNTVEELRALPGIGRYTAHAMAAFAFRKRVPVVDINVRRVLSRVLWRMEDTTGLREEIVIWDTAAAILPHKDVYDWNQALMDLGATICTARSPRCDACPVLQVCRSGNAMRRRHRPGVKREPSRNGVPNRVYRGRIVDTLRSTRTGVSVLRLGRLIAPDFRRSDLPWLHALITALASDGLVKVRRRSRTLSTVGLA